MSAAEMNLAIRGIDGRIDPPAPRPARQAGNQSGEGEIRRKNIVEVELVDCAGKGPREA